MIWILFSFVILGLSLAIPVGSLTIEMFKRGIRDGFWHSWLVGLGGTTGDLVLMVLIYAGCAQFFFIPTVKLLIWTIGSVFLLYLGMESFRTPYQGTLVQDSQTTSLFQSFLSGFAIALSNPISILFWLGIYGSVLAKLLGEVSYTQLLLYSSAIFLGIIIWDLFVSTLVHLSRQILPSRIIRRISALAGLCLIGYGCYFGYQVVTVLI